MPQTFFIVPTAAGDAKDANAKALGQPRKYTHIAVGDGGGALPTPDRARTALVNECYRAQINAIWQDQTNPGQFVAELVIPESVGGWWIRELGLIDADGTLAYYGNCPETYKPQMAEGSGRTQSIRMVVLSASGAAVEVKIDPAIVLATRQYVDDKVATELNKLDGKQSVRVATTAAIAKTALQTIDGVALAAGDRVLVKDQAAPAENGIYVAAAGIWTRAADADQALEVTPGMLVPVEEGAANGDSLWQLATNGPVTIGTTGLAFELVGGKTGVTAGTYRSVTVNTRGQVTGGTNPTTLAGYGITDAAEKDSPVFSGTPTAPTPDPFDNSKRVSNTEFVRKYGHALAGVVGIKVGGATVLDASHVNKLIVYEAGTTAGTLTLPARDDCREGSVIHFFNISSASMTIKRAGADTLNSAGTTIVVGANETLTLTASATPTVWLTSGGTATLGQLPVASFASSKAQNGYQKQPGGLILQWMNGVAGPSGSTYANAFPIQFPTACLGAIGSHIGTEATVNIITDSGLINAAQVGMRSSWSASAVSCFIYAIGY